MTKAAILPFPGDPFLFCLWFKFYQDIWGDEVDRFYLVHNSPADMSVVHFIEHQFMTHPEWYNKIEYFFADHYTDHGGAINIALDAVKEDLVVLLEDDSFIFKKGKVSSCFELIEQGYCDIVAGERASCHTEIVEAATKKFGTGEKPNFWPNCLFVRTDHLRQAGRNYAAKAWYRGETIEPLNHVVENEAVYSDTLVEASLKLRAMGLRVHIEDQYHGMTDDMPDIQQGTNIWSPQAAWCHIGSLSSGISGMLTWGDYYLPLSKWYPHAEFDNKGRVKPDGLPKYCNTEQEKLEWERRVTFWSLAWKFTTYTRDTSEIQEFTDLYEKALHRIIAEYELSHSRIGKRMLAYERALGVTWR